MKIFADVPCGFWSSESSEGFGELSLVVEHVRADRYGGRRNDAEGWILEHYDGGVRYVNLRYSICSGMVGRWDGTH